MRISTGDALKVRTIRILSWGFLWLLTLIYIDVPFFFEQTLAVYELASKTRPVPSDGV